MKPPARVGPDPAGDADRRRYDRVVQDAVLAANPRRLVGPAGTAFLIDGALVHANALNAGTRMRYALSVRFFLRAHYPHGREPRGAVGRARRGGRGLEASRLVTGRTSAAEVPRVRCR